MLDVDPVFQKRRKELKRAGLVVLAVAFLSLVVNIVFINRSEKRLFREAETRYYTQGGPAPRSATDSKLVLHYMAASVSFTVFAVLGLVVMEKPAAAGLTMVLWVIGLGDVFLMRHHPIAAALGIKLALTAMLMTKLRVATKWKHFDTDVALGRYKREPGSPGAQSADS